MTKEFLLLSQSPALVQQLTNICAKAHWHLRRVTTPTGLVVALEKHPASGIWWDLAAATLDTTIATMTLIRSQIAGPITVLTAKMTDRLQRKLYAARVDDVELLPIDDTAFRAKIEQRLWTYQHTDLHGSTPLAKPAHSEILTIGDLTIDLAAYTVTKRAQPVDLTPKEFQLLSYLAHHRQQVLSREQLVNGVWGYDLLTTSRIVDIHISHLRDKLEDDPHQPAHLLTIRGFGYKFV